MIQGSQALQAALSSHTRPSPLSQMSSGSTTRYRSFPACAALPQYVSRLVVPSLELPTSLTFLTYTVLTVISDLRDGARCLNHVSQVVFCLTQSCMQAQSHTEVVYQKTRAPQAPESMQMEGRY